MLDNNVRYDAAFERAKLFASGYSDDIAIDESHKEEIMYNGHDLICIPLSFPAKGNKLLFGQLMASGFCTKMDGSIANGRRIIKVLLWIEPETCELCNVPEELL